MADEQQAKPRRKADGEQQQQSGEQAKSVTALDEQAREQGYWGTRNPRHPDEAYALTSGPDAPTGENGPE